MTFKENDLYRGLNYVPPKEYPETSELVCRVKRVIRNNTLSLPQAIKMYRRLLRSRRGYLYFRNIINVGIKEELKQYTTDLLIEYIVFSAIRECLIEINKGIITDERFNRDYTMMFRIEDKYKSCSIMEFQRIVRVGRVAREIFDEYYVDIILEDAIEKGNFNVDYTMRNDLIESEVAHSSLFGNKNKEKETKNNKDENYDSLMMRILEKELREEKSNR